nr:hypothetical protein CFP56_40366 [Quercus suber]
MAEKAHKTAVSVKPSIGEKPKPEKKNAPQAFTISSSEPAVGEKRKGEEEEEYPLIPCTDEEMNAIIDKWMADRVLRPFKPIREPTPKGRLNGKPIHIAANPTPFDLSEAYYFEATFYDELTINGEDCTSSPVVIPLPSWQDIENNSEIDMGYFLDQRKKKREHRETLNDVSQPRCVQIQLLDGRLGYRL